MSPEVRHSDDVWQRCFQEQIERKRRRRLMAGAAGHRGLLRDLGVFGMVGWSVCIPTLLGTAIGLWIDQRFPGSYSWTLMLLCAGVLLGCWNAWAWLQRHQRDERDG